MGNQIAERISRLTDSVLVGISGGKDSIATLDVCSPYFKRITGYFMYLIPGLEFQERYLSYIENKFDIKILRLPHFQLGKMIKLGVFRPINQSSVGCEIVKPKEYDSYLRDKTGIEWIATGEKAVDSIQRNGMIRKCGGISFKRKRFYPLALWKNATVFNHLKSRGIFLSPEYKMFGRSFGRLWPEELMGIRERYPEDFERIKQYFPFVEANIKRYEYQQASEI